MKIADLALRQGDQPDIGEAKLLVEESHIGLIAADPVECLGDDQIDLAAPAIFDQRLDAGTQHVAAAHRPVGVGLLIGKVVPRQPFTAQANLVLDRGIALVEAR